MAPRWLTRSIRPPPEPLEPNANDPASVPPATVGPPSYTPGDPHGVLLDDSAGSEPPPPRIPRPAPWSGWPAEWWTPDWNPHVQRLTDTAWTCVDLNASLLSTMPPYLVGAAETLDDEWLRNPDPDLYTSWEEFAKQLFWDYQLGEVFVLATARYATGWPARFHVVAPWYVEVEIVAGVRRYSIGGRDVTADLLHVRYSSRVGDARGHGPLEAGASRLVAADVLARYAAGVATSGGIPPSALIHPDELTEQQSADLKAQWITARQSAVGEPAVLSGGITFEAMRANPKEMALVELSEFNESRIAIMLGVPPFLVGLPSGGDSMTYSNVNALFDFHWRAGLRPKAASVMAALSEWLLPRGTVIEVNRDAYVSPEPLARAQTAKILNEIKDADGQPVLSAEQIREIERIRSPDTAEGAFR